MGSVDKPEDEITVLITGFGPFKDQYPLNPSWGIASQLPAYLPPAPAAKASSSSTKQQQQQQQPPPAPLPPVRLLVHPQPVRVSYGAVRDLVPALWESGRRPDLVLHVGMASRAPQYCVERAGRRDGYGIADVDGRRLGDDERRAREGGRWVWHGVPPVLETELDLVDVLGRWRGYLPDDLTLKISDDAGRYLCDFIYFSSLAHLWKAQEYRRVTFLHVPADASKEALDTGREIVIQLIRSILESELSRKSSEELDL